MYIYIYKAARVHRIATHLRFGFRVFVKVKAEERAGSAGGPGRDNEAARARGRKPGPPNPGYP